MNLSKTIRYFYYNLRSLVQVMKTTSPILDVMFRTTNPSSNLIMTKGIKINMCVFVLTEYIYACDTIVGLVDVYIFKFNPNLIKVARYEKSII